MAANASKYYWMRYASDRATIVKTEAGSVRIERGELFGVRELKGKDMDEVVIAKTGVVFRLVIDKSEKLMDRSKEFKGKTPTIAQAQKTPKTPKTQPVEKVIKDRRVVVAPSVQQTADKAMNALLRKEKLTVDALTKVNVARLLRNVADTADDATALRLKKWLMDKVKPTLRTFLDTFNVVEQKPVKVEPIKKQPKTHAPKTTKLKLSEVDMPEIDDFVDDELPSEFRRFMNSENSVKIKRK